MNSPDYRKIFIDAIIYKYPQKKHLIVDIEKINFKKSLDVIAMNNRIFENRNSSSKQKAYSIIDIKYILNFQLENNLNNIETSIFFKISRNTLTSWKKKYNI